MGDTPKVGLILVLEAGLAATRRNRIRTRLQQRGVAVKYVEGGAGGYLEVTGDVLPIQTLQPQYWEGVVQVVPLGPSYPHVAWGQAQRQAPTRVRLQGPPVEGSSIVAKWGSGDFGLIAGPCAVETEERLLRLATFLKDCGVCALRAGAYKPRTSPYAFQGLEEEGLRLLRICRETVGLPIVTEVMTPEHIGRVAAVADMLQVGSRNMQNFALLKELGKVRHPVLLKRGFGATVEELLNAAEYIVGAGNDQVILCERGVRCSAGSGGVVLDLGVVPELRRRTHLPVVVDPSHGSGARHRVAALAKAAVAVGADGLLIEVHDDPDEALSDGRQALGMSEFKELSQSISSLRSLCHDSAGASAIGGKESS